MKQSWHWPGVLILESASLIHSVPNVKQVLYTVGLCSVEKGSDGEPCSWEAAQ